MIVGAALVFIGRSQHCVPAQQGQGTTIGWRTDRGNGRSLVASDVSFTLLVLYSTLVPFVDSTTVTTWGH
jgi:hypothetical protein